MPCLQLKSRVLVLGTLWWMAVATHAQTRMGVFTYGKNKATSVELVSMFEDLPDGGFAPIRVTATNATGREIKWNLDFTSSNSDGKFRSGFSMAVPAGKTETREFLVPLMTRLSERMGWEETGLNVRVTARGLPIYGAGTSGSDGRDWPMIGMSKKLADKWEQAATDYSGTVRKSRGGGPSPVDFASRYDPAGGMPVHWRAFSGFDVMIISEGEWRDHVMPHAEAKNAITQWVGQGGILHVVGSGKPLDLNNGRFGLGNIDFTRPLDGIAYFNRYNRLTNTLNEQVQEHFTSGWDVRNQIGSRSFHAWIVVLLLAVFALLVGPVNLFVFARGGQRHRLFVTTPLISIGTSLLLILLILFRDGIGGTGSRFLMLAIDPESKNSFVRQEQFSRTGVLLGGQIPFHDEAVTTHVLLSRSPWTRVKNDRNDLDFALTRTEPRQLTGSWFFSRSEQAHLTRAVRPTRERVERISTGPGKPVLIASALSIPVEKLCYFDGKDWWKSEGVVAPGSRPELQKAAKSEVDGYFERIKRRSTQSVSEVLNQAEDRAGYFYATSTEAAPLYIETRDLKWRNDLAFLFGPVVEANP